MGPLVSSAPPALWVLGCLALLLWLWVLCTACHRKRAQRQPARLQGVMPSEPALLRPPYRSVLSRSDTRLHELHRGRLSPAAPRPVSVDLLRPQCLDVSRGTLRPPAASSPRELPQARPPTTAARPSTGPEATYSNVGLAAIPRASLAASPVVWAGTRLTGGWARPGPAAAEYTRIQKPKGVDGGPGGLERGPARETPATQLDALYSKVRKPKTRGPGPGPATHQLDTRARAAILTLGRNPSYETLPPRGLSVDNGTPENVYESIQEMGGP